MHSSKPLGPLAGPTSSPSPGDDPRFRALIEWERRTSRQRPNVRYDVREAAYDKAVDALLTDDTLGRDADDRPSAVVTLGLAERCLSWKRAEDLRRRLTPEGRPRSTPRAALSLDSPLNPADEDSAPLGSIIAASKPPVEQIVHWRMQLDEVQQRAVERGDLTRDVITSYLVGGDPEAVARRHGVGLNAVHQVKSRFVARNSELGR
jgi:hypothetical protein